MSLSRLGPSARGLEPLILRLKAACSTGAVYRATNEAARLAEQTPEHVRAGRERIAREGLTGVQCRGGDASTSNPYTGAVPADAVLLWGILGNIIDANFRGTIRHPPELHESKATLIWTRRRLEPDLTPAIRG